MATKKRHLAVYVIFTLILLLDIVLNRFYGKLYPSLVFSLFSEVPKIEKQFDVDTREVYAINTANDTIPIDQARLFQTDSPLKQGVIIDKLLKKAQQPTTSRNDDRQREEFQVYVAEQLHEQKPNEHFKALLISKYKRTIHTDTGEITTQDTVKKQQMVLALK